MAAEQRSRSQRDRLEEALARLLDAARDALDLPDVITAIQAAGSKAITAEQGRKAVDRYQAILGGLQAAIGRAEDVMEGVGEEGATATQHDAEPKQPDVALDALPEVLHLTDTPGSAELHKREGPGGTCWEGYHRWGGDRRPEGGQESHDYRSGGGPDA